MTFPLVIFLQQCSSVSISSCTFHSSPTQNATVSIFPSENIGSTFLSQTVRRGFEISALDVLQAFFFSHFHTSGPIVSLAVSKMALLLCHMGNNWSFIAWRRQNEVFTMSGQCGLDRHLQICSCSAGIYGADVHSLVAEACIITNSSPWFYPIRDVIFELARDFLFPTLSDFDPPS